MTAPLLRVQDLRVTFELHRAGDMPWTKPRLLHAVSGVNFDLMPGETLGIVGESGSGKSTLARALVQMVPATGRAIWQDGADLIALSRAQMLKYRADIQMVFQDPLASLNPRMTVGQIIAEPLRTHHKGLSDAEMKARVKEMMDRVGLLPNQINRYPHEFSGGQRQRIGIARAVIRDNPILILDEPTAALDTESERLVMEGLERLMKGRTVICIAHRLSTIRDADNIVVLANGVVAEQGRHAELIARNGIYADLYHVQFGDGATPAPPATPSA